MQFMWECCENLIMLDLDQLASHAVITVLQLRADFQSDDKKLPRDNYTITVFALGNYTRSSNFTPETLSDIVYAIYYYNRIREDKVR